MQTAGMDGDVEARERMRALRKKLADSFNEVLVNLRGIVDSPEAQAQERRGCRAAMKCIIDAQGEVDIWF